MTNPFLVEMGFNKVEIATVVKTFGFAASMIGAFIGGILVHKWGMLKSLWVCGIFQMLSNLMFLLQAQIGYNVEVLSAVIAVRELAEFNLSPSVLAQAITSLIPHELGLMAGGEVG